MPEIGNRDFGQNLRKIVPGADSVLKGILVSVNILGQKDAHRK